MNECGLCCPYVMVAFCRIFFQRPDNSICGRTATKPATPITELPPVKVPFPRSTTVTQVFKKDQSPKISSHQPSERLTANRRGEKDGQCENKETPYRKA